LIKHILTRFCLLPYPKEKENQTFHESKTVWSETSIWSSI